MVGTATMDDRQHNIWLRDPLAIKVFNREMAIQKLHYIHLNPMQSHWLLCTQPAEYRFSSAIFYEQNMDEFGLLSHFAKYSKLWSVETPTMGEIIILVNLVYIVILDF